MGRDAPVTQQPEEDHNTQVDSKLPHGANLEAEYEALILSQCTRWGISETCITVEVRNAGRGPHGRDVYLAMIRLARWERDSALRILLGLPLLEAKIRKILHTLWLMEVSHFGGLWLHASEQLAGTDAMEELRRLVVALAPEPAPVGTGGNDAFGSVLGQLPPASGATSHAPLAPQHSQPGESLPR
ncbi:hypothetical protein HHL11_22870 [Ramlibacter sp. G-1-2-2]|uniref:Uncharacterized protein n=1 Tax=Ramlibacter agri TaxID=2728837 RepID=A0A848H805_9BURK|nr:hypothetical protein [Ramlibacter agri]NML46607.1 hypothetical protein [Ramlibacter agri]